MTGCCIARYGTIDDKVLQQHFATMEGARFRPPTDVYETEDAVVVIIEVAGLQEDQFEISLSEADRVLTVVGRRQSHERMQAGLPSISWRYPTGVFAVDVPVPWPPQDAQHSTAAYNDGFLVITLPKGAATPCTGTGSRRASERVAGIRLSAGARSFPMKTIKYKQRLQTMVLYAIRYGADQCLYSAKQETKTKMK